MRIFIFMGIGLLVMLLGCAPGTIGIYPVKPVVEVSTDTTMIVSVVPEGSNAGWQSWDSGRDTFDLSFSLKETKGHPFYITTIKVELYDKEGNRVSTLLDKDIIPNTYVEGHGEESFTEEIIIDEGDADDLETADPNDREGYLKIYIKYYDENGEEYSSLPAFRKIKVNHPE
ncbi:hypothetical protein DRQ17_01155 [bacterium]|nr:MAG: hypothetical protein DRQ17_01155 [bacterium]